jgi:rhodanese-related sulfurtransferase
VNLNISKILSIVFISILISLIYNHFNPKGLSLIREARKLDWESDSLTSINNINSSVADTSIKDLIISDSETIEKINVNVESFNEPKAIKLDFAYKLFNDGIKFIDSRSAEEFAEGHVKGAVNIPFYGSENYLDVIKRLNKNEIVVTYCSSADCDISILSGEELFEMGFKKVYVFIGGYDEWTKNNYPTSKK